MLESLKKQVIDANKRLREENLVILTWGNVSGIDREKNLVAIKPSGVPYGQLTVDKIVIVDLKGNKIEGELNPSSDTATHLELYKKFETIKGVAHSHSPMATAWAQSGKNIPVFGTTHSDYFNGDIICSRKMKESEVKTDYEKNTGRLIVEEMSDKNPDYSPGILINGHGPFTWGKSPDNAVDSMLIIEEIAKMAYHSLNINGGLENLETYIQEKHFWRKHGEKAYYGQK